MTSIKQNKTKIFDIKRFIEYLEVEMMISFVCPVILTIVSHSFVLIATRNSFMERVNLPYMSHYEVAVYTQCIICFKIKKYGYNYL